MKRQASLHDHCKEQTAHSRDHKAYVILAIVYAIPIDLQLEVQSTQQEPHQESLQGCQGYHLDSSLWCAAQLPKTKIPLENILIFVIYKIQSNDTC